MTKNVKTKKLKTAATLEPQIRKEQHPSSKLPTTLNQGVQSFVYLKQPAKRYTFEMGKVKSFIEQTVSGKVLNLFAGKVLLNCNEVRVDVDPKVPAHFHMDAYEFVTGWNGEAFDTVILDPPYNLRKSREKYEGRYIGSFTKIKNELPRILKHGATVITFGYDTTGMSASRGFVKTAVGAINHSGDHDDTLFVVEKYVGINDNVIEITLN